MPILSLEIENISKLYRIGSREERAGTLLGDAAQWLLSPAKNLGKLRRLTRFSEEERTEDAASDSRDLIWALKNVSFAVEEGEVVGVIGPNGAGKSTLLKIISRIIDPTSGRALVRGRVSSLLEVGTGFHPELTGRENIFLNGTIMGMKKGEIEGKFDAIAQFAEVDKFLDTPIKKYSSGMRIRLAFAVAAHLDPEILLVDEVLAVGDLSFQKKCMGKMHDVSRGGRTVLFVSHNMAAVQNLCPRTLVLHQGRLIVDGATEEAVKYYMESQRSAIERSRASSFVRETGFREIVTSAEILGAEGVPVDMVRVGEKTTFRIAYETESPLEDPSFGIAVESIDGFRMFYLDTKMQIGALENLSRKGVVHCTVDSLPLSIGYYSLTLVVHSKAIKLDRLESVCGFSVVETDFFGTGKLPAKDHGRFVVKARWEFF